MRMRLVRLIIAAALVCVIVIAPVASSTEDNETAQLARTLHVMASGEDYGTLLAVGSVMLNRVGNPAFADTLEGVLEQTGALTGDEYDVESLRAARELLSGTRTLPENVLYLKREDGGGCWSSDGFFKQLGSFQFFTNI